ncbi:MAG: hypothetical protein WA005_00865 [Candidatus Binataceae bacterium]
MPPQDFQLLQEQNPTIDKSCLAADNLFRAVQARTPAGTASAIETSFIIDSSRSHAVAPLPAENRSVDDTTISSAPLSTHNISPEQSSEESAAKIVIPSQKMPAPRQTFRAIQRWEGTVISVGETGFEAILRDLDAVKPEEKASFLLEEVSPDDHNLIADGAVFYWYVGYETTITGQRKLTANVRFRRLPGWSKTSLRALREKAKRLEILFGRRSAETKDTSGTG